MASQQAPRAMRFLVVLLSLLFFSNCQLKSKRGMVLTKKDIEMDTIKLNWEQRPELDVHFGDIHGNPKDIVKGDTLYMKISISHLMKALRSNSKIIVNQYWNKNCKTLQLNDNLVRIIVAEKPKGSMISFDLMLFRPNTVFQLPNGDAKNKESVFYKDSLGICAFAYKIK